MEKRIIQVIMDSFGTQFYNKAMECLKALRSESVRVSVFLFWFLPGSHENLDSKNAGTDMETAIFGGPYWSKKCTETEGHFMVNFVDKWQFRVNTWVILLESSSERDNLLCCTNIATKCMCFFRTWKPSCLMISWWN